MKRAAWVAVAAMAIGTGALLALGQEDGPAPVAPAGPPPGERVRVEVLNAGGVSGVARAATTLLRDAGFDVVQWGNARTFDRDTSAVIDRVGRPDLAAAVANSLGIPNVLTEPDPNLYLEVTVLVGKDWTGQVAAVEEGAGEVPARAPWDPRGWLGR